MKQVVLVLLSSMLALPLAACGQSEGKSNENEVQAAEQSGNEMPPSFYDLPFDIQTYILTHGYKMDYKKYEGFRKRLAYAARNIPDFNGNDVDALRPGSLARYNNQHKDDFTYMEFVQHIGSD